MKDFDISYWLLFTIVEVLMSDDTERVARVAVLGCGAWTQGWHLPNLAHRKDVNIVALVDPADHPGVGGCIPSLCENMETLVKKYGAPWYKSLEALLADKVRSQHNPSGSH